MWRHRVCYRGRLGPLLKKRRVSGIKGFERLYPSSSPPTRFFTSTTLTPLHYPEAPSKDQHNDLASYITYAKRTGLDEGSKVFIGTHYEYSIAAALRPLGFQLRRIGGHSDKGIDLLGTWALPSMPDQPPMRVLIQCKAFSAAGTARIGPQYIRELEGAHLGAPLGWRDTGVMGLLVTPRPATKGIRDALTHSRWPIGYVLCSREGMLEQILWNRRAEEEGLDGVGITTKYSNEGRHGGAQSLVLTWKGRVYVPPDLARITEPEDEKPSKKVKKIKVIE